MPPTILCADDDQSLCQVLSRALREEGYRVETAHDGDTAVSKVHEIAPSLVILDVLLPKRDGFSVLEAIREAEEPLSQLPVLMVSGCTFTPEYQERARRLAAGGLLTKPVPLEELLTLVSTALGRGHVEKPSTCGDREPVEFAGDLSEVPFPAVLHQLHGLRASGVLQIEHGRKKKQVQVRDGTPVAVRSNLVDECLGNLLAASGRITWDVMHESLQRAQRGEGLQGQILVAMHMLDEEDLAAALRNQAEEKLLEAFCWPRGSFRFHRGARVRGGNALSLKRSTANLIMQGILRRTSLEQIDDFLADRAGLYPAPGQKPYYRFQDIALDESGEALLRRLDGSTAVGDLRNLGPVERRHLYGYLILELLELRPSPERRRRSAHGRPNAAPPAPPDEGEASVRAELAALVGRLRERDYFGVLGVPRTAGDLEIRRAYTELAKRTHPDRFAGASQGVIRLAEEVFGLVSRAYEEIGHRSARVSYLRNEQQRKRDAAELEEGQRALHAELEFQKGEAALRARRYDVAVEHFREAMEAYPEEGEYRAHYGWACYLSEPDSPDRLGEALEHVRAGRKLAPDRQKPYLFLGRLYGASERPDLAEKMFVRAIQLDPDCVEALRELRLLHMRREKSKGLVKRILRR